MTTVTRVFAVAVLLTGCGPYVPPAPPAVQHIACEDAITGEPAFSFWDDTIRDVTVMIGEPGYATVTTDAGRDLTLTHDDMNHRFHCSIIGTRAAAPA